jgi:hypothetical protein
MRTVSDAITNVITKETMYKVLPRITAYKSRVYFENADLDDHAPSLPLHSGQIVLPEAVTLSATAHKAITVVVNTGVIKFLIEGDSSPLTPLISSSPIVADYLSRPAWYGNKLYYSNGSGWLETTIDTDKVVARNTACASAPSVWLDGGVAAVHMVGDGQAIYVYIEDGRVNFGYIDSNKDYHDCPGHIFDPVCVLDATVDAGLIHYSTAAKVGNKIFAYFSRYDGAVVGVYYQTEDGINGSWSDFFVAIPEDLSAFDLTNAISVDGNVFLIGRFYRKDQFSADAVYTLLLQSPDGMTFNMDRRSLVTTIDDRFEVFYDSTTKEVGFIAKNKSYRSTAPFWMIGEDAESITIDMDSVSGSVTSGWAVKLKSGEEEYFANELVAEGNFADLYLGVETGVAGDEDDPGFEFVHYHQCVIESVEKGWADGVREMQIKLLPAALWQTQSMTHPFYMEWQGKQYLQAKILTLDNLYAASDSNGQLWSLSQDFWQASNPKAYAVQTHAGQQTTDTWADDLVDSALAVSYPEFGSSATYQMNIYGWSRAGIPSCNPNEADSTPTSTPNDKFYGLLLVEDLDGVEHTIVTTDGELASNPGFPIGDTSHTNPPQTWFGAGVRAGSYPVSYNLSRSTHSILPGWKIKKLGVRVVSDPANATHSTTYYLERVDMPRITVAYSTTSSVGFDAVTVPNTVFTTQKGVAQILFSVSPYSTWNFELSGRFTYIGPYSYVGLIGLATDKDNFVVGYVRSGYLGLARVNQGIRTTIQEVPLAELIEATHVDGSNLIHDGLTVDVRFWHKDGNFGVEYKLPSTVDWPLRGSQLTHTWETADGVIAYEVPVPTLEETGMSTDSTGSYVYHVGIYAIIDPPKFRTTGFRSSGSIAPTKPCDIDPFSGYSQLYRFPHTGKVSCDDIVYNFSSKDVSLSGVSGSSGGYGKNPYDYDPDTLTGQYLPKARGPYLIYNIQDWACCNKDLVGGYHFTGTHAIEFSDFAWLSYDPGSYMMSSAQVYRYRTLATSDGIAWEAGAAFWMPWITTNNKKVMQMERIRVYTEGDVVINQDVGSGDVKKVWLTDALKGLSLETARDDEVTHDEGTFVYLHSGDKVIITNFMGVSGDPDNTVEGLLAKLCIISGTQASFPGDTTPANITLASGEEVTV